MMKTMLIRSVSGAVYVALIVGTTLMHPMAIAAVLAVIALISMQELMQMMEQNGVPVSRGATFAGAVVLFSGYATSLTAGDERLILPAVGMAGVAPFIWELLTTRQPSFKRSSRSLVAVIYIGTPLVLLVQSAFYQAYFQPYLLLGIFVFAWTNDTFAYLTGSMIGKHKLMPAVSPKKTIEGLLGGALFALAGGWLFAYFNDDLNLWQWMTLAAIVVVFGTLGDLSESVIKRNYNVKDSGQIMPGHGGFLDRIDGLLFIGPAVYAFLILFR
ncbi:MAG: hypothetical protein EA392_01905 [Cryomorphaceae bacterium]|nr:MAG: hypothetical protein EA392_01905 [Cryomorphaceae bacterium]